MSEEQPSDGAAKRERRLAKDFRWQAFFQHCAEPLFVLDRRGRLLFVNRAWETLTGMAKEEAHVLVCRRPRPVSVNDPLEEILAHALTPPPEVRRGASGRIRRLLPGIPAHPSRDRKGAGTESAAWWEVEFLPLLQEGEQGGYLIVGRIRPVHTVEKVRDTPLSEKLVNLRQRRIEHFGLDAWASSLPGVRRLREQVQLASQVATPVLLVGGAGTGKQTLARTIHYLSERREGAFAVLDCRYLPPAAVSDLLFGHHGLGAVYLREPGYLPRDVQLLLCERMRRPLPDGRGSEGAMTPRIFAGCGMPPALAVGPGRMLDELACALGVLMLDVPPLRDRLADLPFLVERMLPRACAGRELRVTSLSSDAWAILHNYSWPGNLRELYNALRSACAHCRSEQLRAADMPAELRRAVQREQTPPRPADKSLPLEHLLEEAERRLIQLALQRAGGRKARAARLLGIPRPRLWRRMVKLGIADTEGEGEEDASE
ncbi:MAG TPA: helix-turn-helix domain-containing protein [Gemmataceae bacterium]|nr:helix-turn-helix domain-containing protein [Gemmataceae bacterium]